MIRGRRFTPSRMTEAFITPTLNATPGDLSLVLSKRILFNILAKGHLKQLPVLFGLAVGYTVALFMGKVDLAALDGITQVSRPKILPHKPVFNLSVIVSTTMFFMASATETIGDICAMTSTSLGCEATDKEIAGSLACDGLISSLSACSGCMPITSFSQNVGLLAMTKVINRYTIATGAVSEYRSGLHAGSRDVCNFP